MSSVPLKFCILTTQRSGSTWLNDLLNSHQHIRSFNEPFLISKYQPFWEIEGFPNFSLFKSMERGARPWVTFQYLKAMNLYSNAFDAVGFKLMYNQLLMFPEIMLKMIKDRYRIVHLIRQNALDLCISYQKARKLQKCHTTETLPKFSVNLDAGSIVRKLNKIQNKVILARTLLSLSGLEVIEIDYEALVSRHVKTILDILEFIKVRDAPIELTSHYKKISRGNYKEKIENYDEIVEVLKNTKFKHLITNTK